jgi:LPXTG-motif cell wall-anchored protein
VRTFNDALDVLLTLARTGIDLAIWVLTIGLPSLLVLSLLWWIVRRLFGLWARVAA